MILRPGTFLQNRYEILEQIGSGGMSDVYKALCHKLNRTVAIKVLKEEFSQDLNFVSKFKMEAQAAAGLSHPNIVSIYDVVDEGSLHYIVMELIEGITLKNYIAQKGFLDNQETIGIAIQVAEGIEAAHQQGIIHRDIKPQNIIIARDGKVKVADFGIARAASSQTVNVTAMGSVHYISPEQARGGYCDIRSDVYSLGITMYEMSTGRLPFQGDNTVTVALAHLEDAVTPPSLYNQEISVSLENIILKCTEKKPEFRYGSMQEVIGDLRQALVNPNGDFVHQVAPDIDSQTVIIGQPELEQIREGRKPVKEGPASGTRESKYQGPRAERQDGSVYESRSHESHSQYAERERESVRRSRASADKKRRKNEDDINPGIEKILTAAGIVAAILIVAILIFVFARLGGLIHTGVATETSASTEATESSTEESTVGAEQVYMPEIEGLSEEEAREKLKEIGSLDMKISDYEFSDTVEEGDVISQDPKVNQLVDRYSSVSVVISKGPEFKEVDLSSLNLEGQALETARTLLTNRNLQVKVENINSNTVPKGNVVSYSPSDPKEGDTVTLSVSMGPALVNPVTVPDIVGQDMEVGAEMLTEAGLTVGTVSEESSEEIAEGLIISQSIEKDTQVEGGTAVDYVVSTGSAQQKQYRYLSSINESYPLQNVVGPGASAMQMNIKVQLKQTVDGKDVITTLMEPVSIKGDQQLPVYFKNIEGAYGVTSGEIQIVNADSGQVLHSYTVTFVPVPLS